jgi:hypothetical protein
MGVTPTATEGAEVYIGSVTSRVEKTSTLIISGIIKSPTYNLAIIVDGRGATTKVATGKSPKVFISPTTCGIKKAGTVITYSYNLTFVINRIGTTHGVS